MAQGGCGLELILWPGAAFRTGIFCSGKERKPLTTGAYLDIGDRGSDAAGLEWLSAPGFFVPARKASR